MKMPVKVKRIGNHSLPLPKYETDGAAGFDLRARVDFEEMRAQSLGCWEGGGAPSGVVLREGEVAVIGCGFAFEIPDGFELQVRPRSGLSKRAVLVALGTVDSDYRGEVGVIVTNTSMEPFRIATGDRIAQGVIAPVVRAELVEAEELSETARGGNGFGSTGSN